MPCHCPASLSPKGLSEGGLLGVGVPVGRLVLTHSPLPPSPSSSGPCVLTLPTLSSNELSPNLPMPKTRWCPCAYLSALVFGLYPLGDKAWGSEQGRDGSGLGERYILSLSPTPPPLPLHLLPRPCIYLLPSQTLMVLPSSGDPPVLSEVSGEGLGVPSCWHKQGKRGWSLWLPARCRGMHHGIPLPLQSSGSLHLCGKGKGTRDSQPLPSPAAFRPTPGKA